MADLQEVRVPARSPDVLAPVIGAARTARMRHQARAARDLLDGRTVWNLNTTAAGGGVAEMLHVLLAYAVGGGVRTRWLVINGSPEFFVLTKRLHNRLHGVPGDDGQLGEAERGVYEGVLADQVPDLLGTGGARSGDIVLLHDPQTAGLAGALRDAGLAVVWRCHVGSDLENDQTREAWSFLRPYLDAPQATVFSREEYVPAWLRGPAAWTIPPSIDPLSAKNRELSAEEQRRFREEVLAEADLVEGRPIPAEARVVLQVSRWDRLKDMSGVMTAFADHIAPAGDAHLVLAGPAVSGVADDPEGAAVRDECIAQFNELAPAMQERVHLASLPMGDVTANALMVNALQRHAAVVVQKSLVEGFGLTASEAMWKARPVVVSAAGGLADQVVDGRTGRVVADPADLAAFGAAVNDLLADPGAAARLGQAARQRVIEEYLPDRHLSQYVDLFGTILGLG